MYVIDILHKYLIIFQSKCIHFFTCSLILIQYSKIVCLNFNFAVLFDLRVKNSKYFNHSFSNQLDYLPNKRWLDPSFDFRLREFSFRSLSWSNLLPSITLACRFWSTFTLFLNITLDRPSRTSFLFEFGCDRERREFSKIQILIYNVRLCVW